jgi:hypothetical protein
VELILVEGAGVQLVQTWETVLCDVEEVLCEEVSGSAKHGRAR